MLGFRTEFFNGYLPKDEQDCKCKAQEVFRQISEDIQIECFIILGLSGYRIKYLEQNETGIVNAKEVLRYAITKNVDALIIAYHNPKEKYTKEMYHSINKLEDWARILDIKLIDKYLLTKSHCQSFMR